MKEEKEEAPSEDPLVHQNCLAQEKHAPGLKKINTVERNQGTSECPKVMGTH
jgi:hypothetical protein